MESRAVGCTSTGLSDFIGLRNLAVVMMVPSLTKSSSYTPATERAILSI
jgi:hypothetical protein